MRLAQSNCDREQSPIRSDSARSLVFRKFRSLAILSTVLTFTVISFVFWQGPGSSKLSAASRELSRLIELNEKGEDRTYKITVEKRSREEGRGSSHVAELRRPPKPPMNDAVLHVRPGHQFVLERKTELDTPFITGSDGKTSWSVRAEGPVRVSNDLTRFHRDLPGHEYQMPLINLEQGLGQLREAYDIRIEEKIAGPAEQSDSARGDRTLAATKRRGFRGPRQVEIDYSSESGQIREIRFIDMPYGPERLTLRLTLVAEKNLGSKFFEHQSHHPADRRVEYEE
ncbi:MAG: hypothetical protein U0903_13910 [Planctomycetales bacterium]